MTEHERELDTLRLEIAEALGWTLKHERARIVHYGKRDIFHSTTMLEVWIGPRGKQHKIGTALTASRMYPFPNWPRDQGAALALCTDFLQQRHASTGEKWQLSIASVSLIKYGCMFVFDDVVQEPQPGLFRGRTAAEALSRLVKAALKRNE